MVSRSTFLVLLILILPVSAFAGKTYVVKKGDNLYDISRKFKIPLNDLMAANSLESNKLDIGDELLIPEKTKDSTKSYNSKTNSSKTEYTVKKGDTLSEIAVKFDVSTKNLTSANNLRSNDLQIGQKILIPGAGPAASFEKKELTDDSDKTEKISLTVTESKVSVVSEAGESAVNNSAYSVKSGDNLWDIARKFGTSADRIKSVNNLKNNKLSIGQELIIPGPGGVSHTAAEKSVIPATSNTSSTGTYTVSSGDTLGGIAYRLGVSTSELEKLNNVDSRKLQIGQVLTVPGHGNEIASREQQPEPAAETRKTETKKSPDTHKVSKGDTLSEIAGKYGVSVKKIKEYNNLQSNNLKIGQELSLIPSKKTVTSNSDKSKTPGVYSKYKVKRGDTLSHIAARFGISQKELKSVNGLKGSNLIAGQVLDLPGTAKTENITAEAKVSTNLVKHRYVVKKGDTLSGISAKYGVTVREIKDASSLKNNSIKVGDILLIPGGDIVVRDSSQNRQAFEYRVVKGDSLGRIGSKYGVSVKELKRANNMKSDRLIVGKKLLIPGKDNNSAAAQKTVSAAKKTSGIKTDIHHKYKVKKGDTLSTLASRCGVSQEAIMSINNLTSSILREGQIMVLPGEGEDNFFDYPATTTTSNTAASNRSRFSRDSIIQVAKKYLGAPYKFGGNSFTTGIDCSGYVKKVFSSFNVDLPRTARDIFYNAGYRVKRNELDTGDLVFFTTYANYPSHVGIYIGNDKFIHASSGARKVTITPMDKKYYKKRYIGAKRVEISGSLYDELAGNY